MPDFDWLPEPIPAHGYGDHLERYINRLYGVFRRDFLDDRPRFFDKRIGQLRRPDYRGKNRTFWHLISHGRVEKNRRLDFGRCERIPWPRPMLEAAARGDVYFWRNYRRGRARVVVSLADYSYIVVLDERPDRRHKRGTYLTLHTAYPVAETHSRRKLRQEHEREQARLAALAEEAEAEAAKAADAAEAAPALTWEDAAGPADAASPIARAASPAPDNAKPPKPPLPFAAARRAEDRRRTRRL